jgi:hypothetical protein
LLQGAKDNNDDEGNEGAAKDERRQATTGGDEPFPISTPPSGCRLGLPDSVHGTFFRTGPGPVELFLLSRRFWIVLAKANL